jgi:hypothetical protein
MSDIDNILTKHQLEAGELTYALKQDLEAYITRQVKEARIDELDRLLRPFLDKRVYGVNAELTINAHNRIVGLRKELGKWTKKN